MNCKAFISAVLAFGMPFCMLKVEAENETLPEEDSGAAILSPEDAVVEEEQPMEEPSRLQTSQPAGADDTAPENYTYSVTPLLPPFNRFIYVETDNPNPRTIRFVDKDTKYAAGDDYTADFWWDDYDYLDIEYADREKKRIAGGYIFFALSGDSDGGELALQYDRNAFLNRSGSMASYSANWRDTDITVTMDPVKSTNDFLIDTYTDDTMTFWEKMDACQEAMETLAVYPHRIFNMEKPNEALPYALLFSSIYPENKLMSAFHMYEESSTSCFLSMVYPFVRDSASFPGTMRTLARTFAPDCTGIHTQIQVTYEGESRIYGGQGKGGNSPVRSGHLTAKFSFDGSADDFMTASLSEMEDTYLAYSAQADADIAADEEKVTGTAFRNTVGTGSWIMVNYEPMYINRTPVNTYAFVSSSNRSGYSASWIDGRYVNNRETFEPGKTLADYPTAPFVIPNMTYTRYNGVQVTASVTFRYEEANDRWSAASLYGSSTDVPDAFYLSRQQVEERISANTNTVPDEGFIYNGTAEPGTPFGTVHVTGITMDENITVPYGSSVVIRPTVLPENATDRRITWTGTNDGVVNASTDQSGAAFTVRGTKEGTASFTARTQDGGYTATINVTVVKYPVESIEIEGGDKTIRQGQSDDLNVLFTPEYAADKNVTYTSSDTATVRITGSAAKGYQVYGVKVGEAQVTATSANGKTDTITVTVEPQEAEGIAFNESEYDISLNANRYLYFTFTPTIVTDKTVTAVSADTGIARVVSTGTSYVYVKGVGVGRTTITVTTANGISASCTVNVMPVPVESIAFRQSSYEIVDMKNTSLMLTILPSNASDKSYTVSFSDPDILEVWEKNANYVNVQPKKAGKTDVTVTTANGLSATTTVTVEPVVPKMKFGSLLLSGQIGVVFYMYQPDPDFSYNGPYIDCRNSTMDFTVSGIDGKTETGVQSTMTYRLNGTTYYGYVCRINSIQMADDIEAVFHYKDDGADKTLTYHYSAKEYLETAQEMEFDETTTALYHALADYGHHAQVYLSEIKGWTVGSDHGEMDMLFTESYDAAAIKAATDGNVLSGHMTGGIQDASFSLVLDSGTGIYLYLKPADGYAGALTADTEGNDLPVMKVNGWYRIELADIAAHELSKTFHVLIHMDEYEDAYIDASAFSYVNAILDTDPDNVKAVNTVCSLYTYSAAADAYKAAH